MKRKLAFFCLSLCLVVGNMSPALAGGVLEDIDITGLKASPLPGLIEARIVGIKWDARSMPVKYSMNTTLDPIPNPLGAPTLTLAQAQEALQRSFDAWNKIPTSFLESKITATTTNPGVVGFDMVNELTFRTAAGFTAIASSPSVSLIADSTFVEGDDIDGDGDSDVAKGIKSCADVDGDGDIEFPEGDYKAGTILDNDIQFNTKTTNGFRFTTGDAALDTITRSVDIETVAVHEFGHSHGLSHTPDNQISVKNGNGSTMFPFIDTGDPVSELNQRSPATDDIAWCSFIYPEGSASSGPAAIRLGDIPFKFVFGVLKGELRHGVLNQPIAGGNVFAYNEVKGERVVSGFSGATRLSLDPATGGLFLADPSYDIINGIYQIPVPLGLYSIGTEAIDGEPVSAASVSFTAQIGQIYGQQDFNEEFYTGRREAAREVRLNDRLPVLALPSVTQSNLNIITSDSRNLNNFGALTNIGFTGAAPGTYYAVQVPASQITGVNPGGELLIQGVAFDTYVADASVVPVFNKAMLTTGVVNPDNTVTVDVANPLEVKTGFVGQDSDFASLYFNNPAGLGKKVLKGIASGQIQNLFLVLQTPTTTPYPGVSGFPPFIALSTSGPLPRLAFTSADGGTTWVRQTNFNFRFSLVVSLPK
jgi:hypothetical protein